MVEEARSLARVLVILLFLVLKQRKSTLLYSRDSFSKKNVRSFTTNQEILFLIFSVSFVFEK